MCVCVCVCVCVVLAYKNFLMQTTSICIELKREGDKKSHKKIGSVEIDLKPSSPGRAILEEQWYPVKVDKQDKASPALRIRHRSDLS